MTLTDLAKALSTVARVADVIADALTDIQEAIEK